MCLNNKNKNEELIASAMNTLHKMEEKRKWAEKEATHIIKTFCMPFVVSDNIKK